MAGGLPVGPLMGCRFFMPNRPAYRQDAPGAPTGSATETAETRTAPADNGESFVARIPTGRRIWAVPSIHGEAAKLTRLHAQLMERIEPGHDRLVYLGNYLGHGTAVAETLDELLRYRRALLARPGVEPWDILYLRGAQEEMWWKLLKLQMAADPRDALGWMASHGVGATLEAYGGNVEEGMRRCREGVMALTKWTGGLRQAMNAHPGHVDLLTSLWRAARSDDGSLLFVHASVDPTRPLSMQGDIFWWDTGGFARIESPFMGISRVIRGYDHSRRGPDLEAEIAVTVDAGCGFSGPLIAAAFGPSGQVLEHFEV